MFYMESESERESHLSLQEKPKNVLETNYLCFGKPHRERKGGNALKSGNEEQKTGTEKSNERGTEKSEERKRGTEKTNTRDERKRRGEQRNGKYERKRSAEKSPAGGAATKSVRGRLVLRLYYSKNMLHYLRLAFGAKIFYTTSD